jgi:formylmethanofuran--tetrahydromethanopterin N-formyltransferase
VSDPLVLDGAEVVDTYAEAFSMWGARVLITAATPEWATEAARSMTGFATSVIGCKCEAGIEGDVDPGETPDGRPGVNVLLFTMSRKDLAKRLVERIGQSVLTCPTTACFDGLQGTEETADVGGQLRFFGDGWQQSKVVAGRRYWRVPVMEGEFLVQERFGMTEGVGGGNLIFLAEDVDGALGAAQAAARAMHDVRGVVLPFPGGIVRSGSKVGSRYSSLSASTNDPLCPTIRAVVPETEVPDGIGSVMEIVIDGLSPEAVSEAMAVGLRAACRAGARHVTAGNYGGKLGQHHFHLHELVPAAEGGRG